MITAPPKLTIPPEIVPIFMPSLLMSNSTTPPPCPYKIVYVQAGALVKLFAILVEYCFKHEI